MKRGLFPETQKAPREVRRPGHCADKTIAAIFSAHHQIAFSTTLRSFRQKFRRRSAMPKIGHSESGDFFALRANHAFGRDASCCQDCTKECAFSGARATGRFAGGLWRRRDKSSCDTLTIGTLLRNGAQATLWHGGAICFGKPAPKR
ncbi:hypothetical protein [Paraburkholderia sp. PGU19]|uniref:hypothetical protein n=1 Tax=Paraburkholderia sp. PGU19 TaxID=2735434 RepID=UPI0015DB9CA9|nr:hypothetical protein [Paraburkholderia sp. PGU19]